MKFIIIAVAVALFIGGCAGYNPTKDMSVVNNSRLWNKTFVLNSKYTKEGLLSRFQAELKLTRNTLGLASSRYKGKKTITTLADDKNIHVTLSNKYTIIDHLAYHTEVTLRYPYSTNNKNTLLTLGSPRDMKYRVVYKDKLSLHKEGPYATLEDIIIYAQQSFRGFTFSELDDSLKKGFTYDVGARNRKQERTSYKNKLLKSYSTSKKTGTCRSCKDKCHTIPSQGLSSLTILRKVQCLEKCDSSKICR